MLIPSSYRFSCDSLFLDLQYQALGFLTGGFAVFGLIGAAAWYNNKPTKQPFVSSLSFLRGRTIHCQYREIDNCLLQAPKEFPYDNLKKELGSR